MAWNQPGGGDKDPWGKRKASDQFEVDKALRNLQSQLRRLFGVGGDGAPNFGIGLIFIVAIGIWLLTGFYVIQQGERGVILRFGKKTELTEAGLHWRFPFPVERVEKVNVEKVSTVEIGYRSNLRSGNKSKIPKEALMLTEDENIIDIEFAVQYRINDAANYVFNVRDPEATIGQATEAAIREIVGRSNLDYIFENRKSVEDSVRQVLQKIIDSYQIGVGIQAVEMQRAQPPDEVKAAFDDAVKAREDRERLKNEAEAYANDVIPRARGGAARLMQEAEGYRAGTIARADGDARRFSQIATEYAKAPSVTRERLYIETMEQVLSNTSKVLVDQKNGNNMIYLPLDKLMSSISENGTPAATAEPDTATSGKNANVPRGRGDFRSRRAAP